MALAWAVAPVAEAQPPIRIGASLAQTGAYAAPGQNQLRGYQLCVKHMNEKGGVLGRKLELVVYDDGSDPATAVRLYEKLITQDKVDLVLGPYTSPITDAVADVSEKHRMPMVAPSAAATSIYRKGRKFIFGMLPPGEVYLEGLIDLAAKNGLRTVALINGDDLFGRARRAPSSWPGRGASGGLCRRLPGWERRLLRDPDQGPGGEPRRAGRRHALRGRGGHHPPDEGVERESPDDGLTVGVDLPKFYEALGRDAEFVYGATPWVPELVELRAGGLIPIARQYPGAREFVESTGRSSPAPISPITPLPGTAVARFSSRPSGAPGLWTARSSATPF